MGIGLMADIPDQLVSRSIKNIMQGDRELNNAEAGGKMAAGPGYDINHELANFFRKLGQLPDIQLFQVFGEIYTV
jgi:hypothetical protein